jgi:hypothetical protein
VRYFVHGSERGPEFLGEVTPRGVLKKLIPKTAQQPDDNLHITHSGSSQAGRQRIRQNLAARYQMPDSVVKESHGLRRYKVQYSLLPTTENCFLNRSG